ncbi:hypothetical protein OPQ81_001879 [Rhizoctonia solani]|nr:hypothetical protein OPQ81_001879 [Rhizoctonia solani]
MTVLIDGRSPEFAFSLLALVAMGKLRTGFAQIKFGYASPVISMLLEYACKTEGRNLSLVPRYTRFTSGFCKQLCRLDPPKRCRLNIYYTGTKMTR